MIKYKTREEWLTKATNYCRNNLFKRHGYEIPLVRVACGFPAGTRPEQAKTQKVGQYWKPDATADKIGQVFISPLVQDPLEALAILIHELVHAVKPDSSHGREFKQVAGLVGLDTQKPTQAIASERLREELKALSEALGEYPHSAITLSERKKQASRLVKLQCPKCGYIVRTTEKWLRIGVPACPVDNMLFLAS